MEVTANNLGNRIKELRMMNKLTQEKLAEHANLHVSYIGMIERGEKNLSVRALNDILVALNVSLIEFFKPFDQMASHSNNNEIYDSILFPLQTLSIEDKNKVLEIIRLAISLVRD